jgi:putative transposase
MKQLICLRLSDLWKEVKSEEALWGDLKLETKEYLKMLMQNILKEEQKHSLACARYERGQGRVDFRNGYYSRDIESSLGLIKDIKVPRNRITSYESILFKKYKRKEISLIQLIKDAFLSGLSTRKVGEVFETILGYKISPTTVSNIAKSLDSKVRVYHTKNLEDKYVYLFLDGITLKIKSASARNRKVILVAYGVTASGIKEIIAFKIASSESELEWYMFVDSLYRRGLAGKNLNLIIIDVSPSSYACSRHCISILPYPALLGAQAKKCCLKAA